MRFTDALVWILSIYVIYYVVIIIYDSFVRRSVKDVTGVQEIMVVQPADRPKLVSTANNKPKPVVSLNEMSESDEDDDESNSGGSVVQKKK